MGLGGRLNPLKQKYSPQTKLSPFSPFRRGPMFLFFNILIDQLKEPATGGFFFASKKFGLNFSRN